MDGSGAPGMGDRSEDQIGGKAMEGNAEDTTEASGSPQARLGTRRKHGRMPPQWGAYGRAEATPRRVLEEATEKAGERQESR